MKDCQLHCGTTRGARKKAVVRVMFRRGPTTCRLLHLGTGRVVAMLWEQLVLPQLGGADSNTGEQLTQQGRTRHRQKKQLWLCANPDS